MILIARSVKTMSTFKWSIDIRSCSHRKRKVPSSNLTVGKRKKMRSGSVLWQKPLHQQKSKTQGNNTKKTPPNTLITQRFRTDLGRSDGVTTAIPLVLRYHRDSEGTTSMYFPKQHYESIQYPKNRASIDLVHRMTLLYFLGILHETFSLNVTLQSPHCDWRHNSQRDVTLSSKKW